MIGGLTRHMLPMHWVWMIVTRKQALSQVVIFEWVWSCVDLRKILAVCSTWENVRMCLTWERFWSCVGPENVFGRVCELKIMLVMCSIWERFWSCVRPEKDIGRVFDVMKIFGRVFDLRKILPVWSTWLYVTFCCYIFCWTLSLLAPVVTRRVV